MIIATFSVHPAAFVLYPLRLQTSPQNGEVLHQEKNIIKSFNLFVNQITKSGIIKTAAAGAGYRRRVSLVVLSE